MNYYTFPPSKKLRGLVRFFWVFENTELNESYIYRSMADPCCELIFHYKGRFDEITENNELDRSFLSGIHSQTHRYRRFITKEAFGIFGAYLYPFAVHRLLDMSPVELTNQMSDLYSVLGRDGKNLEEQIFLAPDNKSRCNILTAFLEDRLCKYQPDVHPAISAVRHVIDSKKNHSVRELAHHFNLSERQFERKFKEYSGFSPKKYMRIVRFGEACEKYAEAGQRSLTEIALSCGYYDQSHFIKDFKTFSGYHPSVYFSGEAEGIEWRDLQVDESDCERLDTLLD